MLLDEYDDIRYTRLFVESKNQFDFEQDCNQLQSSSYQQVGMASLNNPSLHTQL